MTRRITLCGSFGCGNTGDEAVLPAFEDLSEEAGIDAVFDCLGRFPFPLQLPHVISLAPDDSERRASIAGQPLALVGGGIIEPKDRATVFRCQDQINSARSAVLFGASVEPGVSYSLLTRWKLKRVFSQLDRLYVRDVLSYEVAKKNFPKFPIKALADIVLALRPDSQQHLHYFDSQRPYIAVSLVNRYGDNPAWLNWMIKELFELAKEFKRRLVFIPMAFLDDDDRPLHRKIALNLKEQYGIECQCIEVDPGPRGIASMFASAEITVAMRLHAAVMSYAGQTPFVVPAYHPKLYGFARTVGWENAMIPRINPMKQDDKVYGFSAHKIIFQQGIIRDTALDILVEADFSRLPILRQALVSAYKEWIEMLQ